MRAASTVMIVQVSDIKRQDTASKEVRNEVAGSRFSTEET